jgi:death on curing protein
VESALARPAAYAHYENADLAHQATALAQGIAEGQQFVDGNKRTALVAMLTFLEVNGLGVSASDRELADWISGSAQAQRRRRLLRSYARRLIVSANPMAEDCRQVRGLSH